MTPYRARSPFRSTSRPDLGTVPAGSVVMLDEDHASDLGALVEPAPSAHTVGEHAGGGWYPVLDPASVEVDRVRGRAEAEARADALNDQPPAADG